MLRVALLALLLACVATPASGTVYEAEQYFRDSLYLAYNAFCNRSNLMAWDTIWSSRTIPVQVVHVLFNTSTETHGYVGYSARNRTIVVSFRGTDNVDNWILDVKPERCDYYGARAHCGFVHAYTALAGQVRGAVAAALRACPPCTDALFTGHSLGAAMAGVALVDIAQQFPRLRTSLVNFGMPRVGEASFVALFNRSVTGRAARLVHYHDIVPHVPIYDIGYRHVCTEHWNASNTNTAPLRVCDSGACEDRSCADSLPAWQLSRADHMTYLGVYNGGGCARAPQHTHGAT